jgi:ATP-dependent exoDNAse (exonuclease V) alpha subunit
MNKNINDGDTVHVPIVNPKFAALLARTIAARKEREGGNEKSGANNASGSYSTPLDNNEKPATTIPKLTLEQYNKISGFNVDIDEDILPEEVKASKPPITAIHNNKLITYNAEQSKAIELISQLKSCILLGAAGTGKTTTMKGALEALAKNPQIPIIEYSDHKFITRGLPGILCVSYTRRAVNNLRKALPEGLNKNCITIHKALEYQPVFDEVFDEEAQKMRTTMQFSRTRNAGNPLPSSIRVIIIDEASMVSVQLFEELREAAPNAIFIFVGDIQQLPPTFGTAILGYKMLELPTIELVQVYRQALDSPIIRLAHRILSGRAMDEKEITSPEWNIPGKLGFYTFKKKFSSEDARLIPATMLTRTPEQMEKITTLSVDWKQALLNYEPTEDMILCPFNQSFGTIELNKHIAGTLARRNGRIVHEVIAGFNKHYFSVGDKVLCDKEDAIITDIKVNASYSGKPPQEPSVDLNYFGNRVGNSSNNSQGGDSWNPLAANIEDMSEEEQDALMEAATQVDRVAQASHVITVRLLDSEQTVIVNTASEVNAMLLAYALTVHKSQGSEYRRVFLVMHHSHTTMNQRELLYTAVTRAREELYIICEKDTFSKGITNQRIKGNTLAEKAHFFMGKVEQDKMERARNNPLGVG